MNKTSFLFVWKNGDFLKWKSFHLVASSFSKWLFLGRLMVFNARQHPLIPSFLLYFFYKNKLASFYSPQFSRHPSNHPYFFFLYFAFFPALICKTPRSLMKLVLKDSLECNRNNFIFSLIWFIYFDVLFDLPIQEKKINKNTIKWLQIFKKKLLIYCFIYFLNKFSIFFTEGMNF